ncbi:cytochrome c peroxidase [Danxiaibacter flavus]|uniref:Cytochrome c peroxidase n=1 Tax=Danxiaibacter flavus TaxID=3049108 RepID=A0ABV3ZH86_9BACT|nr:cytochrome c peroxidase [Chitinophagaceae bacterium DXS]
MKFIAGIFTTICCMVIYSNLAGTERSYLTRDRAVDRFNNIARKFSSAALELKNSVELLDSSNPSTIAHAKQALKQCRLQYKGIEFLMEYFFKSAAVIYNGPPKFEVEEPYMEYQEPTGLQVIEGLLFEKITNESKVSLREQADIVYSSAKDLTATIFGFKATDNQILESIKLELIRINTLGITGYDAPLLKTGIEESEAAFQSIQYVLSVFAEVNSNDSVGIYLSGSIKYLQDHPGFDDFDRLTFLTEYALPLERNIHKLINEKHLELNTSAGILNYDAGDLFNDDVININAFPSSDTINNQHLVQLGKKLFFEKALSANNKISCATCHDPAKHFSDGLPKSVAFDGHSHVTRNAPSLFYAGFQFGQFWDARAKTLEEQIQTVVSNPSEMNSNGATVVGNLSAKSSYHPDFKRAFSNLQDSLISFRKVSQAIAAYVRTLNPRTSAFDDYIKGDKSALTKQQIKGFNLFMGKAQCGTCHFAPLFNGLVPPLYNMSELEVLGTPANGDLEKALNDTDNGRYNFFPLEVYQKAFKTPTVRNASATAPYMHNGAFKTLEKVVEFYNKGGGNGIGLNIKGQTLSSIPLNLNDDEIKDIVSFINSLEDKVPG